MREMFTHAHTHAHTHVYTHVCIDVHIYPLLPKKKKNVENVSHQQFYLSFL